MFGQAVTGGVAGTSNSAGGEARGEGMDQEMENMEGKEPEGKREPEGEGFNAFDHLSDVEMGDWALCQGSSPFVIGGRKLMVDCQWSMHQPVIMTSGGPTNIKCQ